MGSEEDKPSLEAPRLSLPKRRKATGAPPEPTSGQPPTGPAEPTVDHTPPEPTSGQPPTEPAEPTVDHTPPEPTSGQPPTGPAEPTGRQSPPVVTEPRRTRQPRRSREPINAHLAAALAGLVVGGFLVASTYGGLQACESVRGTTSCGGGPGFALLVLVMIVAVVLGAAVLRWARVRSAGSISVLAVALVAVVSMLFLLDVLDRVGGAVAVMVVSVAAYALAHWVTARYVDEAGEPAGPVAHDRRSVRPSGPTSSDGG